jgi:hypothetical protein
MALGHPIDEIRAIFENKVASPEVTDDEESTPYPNNPNKLKRKFLVLDVSWRSEEVHLENIILFKHKTNFCI